MCSQIKGVSDHIPLMLRNRSPLHVADLIATESLLTVRIGATAPAADLRLGIQEDRLTALVTLLGFFTFS